MRASQSVQRHFWVIALCALLTTGLLVAQDQPTNLPAVTGTIASVSKNQVTVRTDKGKVYASADKKLSVNPDVEFCKKMRQLVGDENFQLAK